MFDLASVILEALSQRVRVAVATVVGVEGSSPRSLGTSMAVSESGQVFGSISGGCVEGAVYDACLSVLETGASTTEEFGFSDSDAFAVGLACGGRLTIAVQEVLHGSTLAEALEGSSSGQPTGLAILTQTLWDGPVTLAPNTDFEELGALPGMDIATARRVEKLLESSVHLGNTHQTELDCGYENVIATFVVRALSPRMIIFGAVDYAAALARAAQGVGYDVTICDARPVFATQARFPDVEVVVMWPTDYLQGTQLDERTVICVLTHDDKFDVPIIALALRSQVAYVGAMGSRATHSRRVEQLLERGVHSGDLSRLRSPIGLDIGASTPEETAISILAEIIGERTGASSRPLRSTTGPIHQPYAGPEPTNSNRRILEIRRSK